MHLVRRSANTNNTELRLRSPTSCNSSWLSASTNASCAGNSIPFDSVRNSKRCRSYNVAKPCVVMAISLTASQGPTQSEGAHRKPSVIPVVVYTILCCMHPQKDASPLKIHHGVRLSRQFLAR